MRKPITVLILAFLFVSSAHWLQVSNAQPRQSGNSRSHLTHGQLADEVKYLLERSSPGMNLRSERQILLEDLGARELPADANERLELSRAWRNAATLVRETEGTTPFLARALKIASELDPSDLALARNAAYEAVRQEKINARIEQARVIAAAKEGAKR